MAFLELEFNFSGTQGTPPANGTPQALTGNSAVLSTNVYDALAAKKLFAGSLGKGPKLSIDIPAAMGGTSPTFMAQLIGADNAALSSNPITLAQIGTTRVLTAADFPFHAEVAIGEQLDAKRYYGVSYTMGGTSPTAGVNANIVADAQSSGAQSGGANLQP